MATAAAAANAPIQFRVSKVSLPEFGDLCRLPRGNCFIFGTISIVLGTVRPFRRGAVPRVRPPGHRERTCRIRFFQFGRGVGADLRHPAQITHGPN